MNLYKNLKKYLTIFCLSAQIIHTSETDRLLDVGSKQPAYYGDIEAQMQVSTGFNETSSEGSLSSPAKVIFDEAQNITLTYDKHHHYAAQQKKYGDEIQSKMEENKRGVLDDKGITLTQALAEQKARHKKIHQTLLRKNGSNPLILQREILALKESNKILKETNQSLNTQNKCHLITICLFGVGCITTTTLYLLNQCQEK